MHIIISAIIISSSIVWIYLCITPFQLLSIFCGFFTVNVTIVLAVDLLVYKHHIELHTVVLYV